MRTFSSFSEFSFFSLDEALKGFSVVNTNTSFYNETVIKVVESEILN